MCFPCCCSLSCSFRLSYVARNQTQIFSEFPTSRLRGRSFDLQESGCSMCFGGLRFKDGCCTGGIKFKSNDDLQNLQLHVATCFTVCAVNNQKFRYVAVYMMNPKHRSQEHQGAQKMAMEPWAFQTSQRFIYKVESPRSGAATLEKP